MCFAFLTLLKKGVNVWFAVDNIDLLEDTAYGQNTFHGTIMVLNQREDKNAESMNGSLIIPDKLPPVPLNVRINYLKEPAIQLKPIRFSKYNIGERDNLLSRYKSFNHTWMLSNFLANDTLLADNESSNEVSKQGNIENTDEGPTISQFETQSSEIEREDNEILHLSEISCPNEAVDDGILKVINKTSQKKKTGNKDIMTT